MSQSGVSMMSSQRTDRLLRSLVGVVDVRLVWNTATHRLRAVHILRDARTQPHQLIRNIVSGLNAAFGIELLPTQVHVHDDARVFEAIVVASDVLDGPAESEPALEATSAAPTPLALPTGASNGTYTGNGNGNGHGNGVLPHPDSGVPVMHQGNGHANGNGGGGVRKSAHEAMRVSRTSRPDPMPARAVTQVPTVDAAPLDVQREDPRAPVIERIDLDRRDMMIRCRTTLSVDGRMYSAIAEVPDSPTAEAEVAARVALDALRAGCLTNALLDGVGFITIAHTNYCVAAVRESGVPGSRAGIAPLVDSLAASATKAVLGAL